MCNEPSTFVALFKNGKNLGSLTDLILSNGFELTTGFNFSSNILSFTSLTLFLFLKP